MHKTILIALILFLELKEINASFSINYNMCVNYIRNKMEITNLKTQLLPAIIKI